MSEWALDTLKALMESLIFGYEIQNTPIGLNPLLDANVCSSLLICLREPQCMSGGCTMGHQLKTTCLKSTRLKNHIAEFSGVFSCATPEKSSALPQTQTTNLSLLYSFSGAAPEKFDEH